MHTYKFGVIGSGSWATAIAKILTDAGHSINWWIRSDESVAFLKQRRHNPKYLSHAYFDINKITPSANLNYIIHESDVLILAVPSSYAHSTLNTLNTDVFEGKKIISAIKGILPEKNQLLHEYLQERFGFSLTDYFTLLGPCHAEEVAAEKLSYLTISGANEIQSAHLAACFQNEYVKTIVNPDVMGVQYAAILKNIYALGAGIAHGLKYGDNFQSVYIANSANEMVRFLREVKHEALSTNINYAASVYLGDLLVTCYSLYSRNRMLGNMLGKGYSVKAALLEMGMVAEGYNAAKCIHKTNDSIQANIPIADLIYQVLWEGKSPEDAFNEIEKCLV